MTAAPHCHELSRQSPSRRTPRRVRACAGAPACVGINGNCRVSARQCALVIPACGLPPVGHDVGTGCGRADGSDGCPAPARAAHGPTSPNGRGGGGLWVTGVGTRGLGTSRGGTGPLRPREQPRFPTEFVCVSERRAGHRARAARWANVGEPVANRAGTGAGGPTPIRRRSDSNPTGPAACATGMNGIAIAARS